MINAVQITYFEYDNLIPDHQYGDWWYLVIIYWEKAQLGAWTYRGRVIELAIELSGSQLGT